MSDTVVASTFSLRASDGASLFVYRWLPQAPLQSRTAPVRAVIQVVHGAAEHAGRYDRLARVLVRHNYAVYADDHRGHGRTAGSLERAGIVGADSWERMLLDLRELTACAADAHPGAPIVLLGHSMGSMLGQAYAQRFGECIDGLILSGSASSLAAGAEDLAERADVAVARDGADAPSMDFAALFAGFNDAFTSDGASATGFEWLSRDTEEVARYVGTERTRIDRGNVLPRRVGQRNGRAENAGQRG